jgi:acyl carrier protein
MCSKRKLAPWPVFDRASQVRVKNWLPANLDRGMRYDRTADAVQREYAVEVQENVREILRDVLSLGRRADRLTASSALLGAVPELDSMAVIGVIAALEDRFGFTVEDDEISGSTFATLGSLVEFVSAKTASVP